MTNENQHLDPLYIQDLEKKYMEKISEIVFGETFIKDLKSMESLIKKRFDRLEKLYPIKRFYNIGWERIIKYSVPKILAKHPYVNPATSDLAFYPVDNDCILNIDTKVVNENESANLVDKDTCVAGKNQTTLNYISPENENIIKEYEFAGIDFKSNLLEDDLDYKTDRSLPVLTFILKCVYNCDHLINKTFDLKRLDLTCIPHQKVFNNNWPEESIIYPNVKFYEKIHKMKDFAKLPNSIKKKFSPIKKNEFNFSNKIKFHKQFGNTKKEFYLDTDLKHPLRDKNKHIAWSLANLTNKYYAFDSISTPRLVIKKDRTDSENNSWLGHLEMDLSSSS